MQHKYGWVLLSVYFILHGWQYYSTLLGVADVFEALLIVLLSAGIIWLSSVFLFKTPEKRSLITTFTCFLFFFANPLITTFSARQFLPGILEQMLFIIVAVLLLWIILSFFKNATIRLNKFLNFFLSVLVVLAFFQVLNSALFRNKTSRPLRENFYDQVQLKERKSIYVIILDEYAGKETLAANFNYNNNRFIYFLKSRKFQITDSAISNYSFTLLSMPSIFSGSYISKSNGASLSGVERNKEAMFMMYEDNIIHYFSRAGYRIKNYSPFSINIADRYYDHQFLPTGKFLLLYPSLIDDLVEKVPEFFVSKLGSKQQLTSFYAGKGNKFEQIFTNVLKDTVNGATPMFTYMHLMMPHYPYIWDSTGNVNIGFLSNKGATEADKKNAYLQQLAYTNNVVSGFIDSLLLKTNGNSIIVLMSDHGYKSGGVNKLEDRFNTINAVYYPGQPNLKRYKGMSNVNQFRSILSCMASKELPWKIDSLVLK